ncbi:DUF4232 domain-containing protein [Streptomyces monticola]|uniref:DUF4232 domain-containing protein n=1 Tax=Streptomyces monticola TaxID=2666263 RepID=A0ABW2JGL6_9ACTN
MSRIRTSRTRLAGAAAAAVLASLALTACDSGTGVNDEGASSTSPTGKASESKAPGSGAGSGAGSGSGSGSGSSPSSTDAKPGPGGSTQTADTSTSKAPGVGEPVTCEGSNTKTVAAPLNRPVNHMLLTVTNTGSKSCFLYTYPALRFGEAQAVPPVIEDSQPQAVVTLKPGESGYASVALSGAEGSSDGHTEKSLAVYFHGRSGNESVGAPAHPPLPAKGAYIDNSLKVTYWQQTMEDAIVW